MNTRRTALKNIGATLGAAATLLTASGAVFAQNAGSANQVTLRIAYLKGTSDLTLAKARGTLEKTLSAQGVKIVWAGPFPAAAPAFEALNANAVDLTSGSSTSFVTAIAAGIPMSIFAYQPMTNNNEAIVVHKDSPYKTLADLAGKSVAVNRGGTGEYLLLKALVRNGVPVDSVKRRYLSPSDAGSAFVGGAVDGWAIWDPFLSIALKNYNGRVLADGATIGSENAIGYFVRQDYLQAHLDVVRTVFKVLKQENAWAAAHPTEAGKIWANELNVPEALASTLGANNVSPLRTLQADDIERIRRIAQLYVENKIIPAVPDIANISK